MVTVLSGRIGDARRGQRRVLQRENLHGMMHRLAQLWRAWVEHPQLWRRRARGCGREQHAPGLPADGLGVVHAVEALGEEGIGRDRRGDALDLGLGARRADGRRPGTSLCGGLLPATRERGARGGAELEGGAEGGGHLSYFGESAERCADARVPGAVSGRQREDEEPAD